MNTMWKGLLVVGLCALSQVALAGVDARILDPVPLKAGPDMDYPTVTWLDEHERVELEGCLSTRDWCEVQADLRGFERGWVPAYAVARIHRNSYWSSNDTLFWATLPLLGYDGWGYWDRHYRGQPWYRSDRYWFDRTYPFWRHPPRPHHRDHDRRGREHWDRRDWDRDRHDGRRHDSHGPRNPRWGGDRHGRDRWDRDNRHEGRRDHDGPRPPDNRGWNPGSRPGVQDRPREERRGSRPDTMNQPLPQPVPQGGWQGSRSDRGNAPRGPDTMNQPLTSGRSDRGDRFEGRTDPSSRGRDGAQSEVRRVGDNRRSRDEQRP